jgi:hypothetical protein
MDSDRFASVLRVHPWMSVFIRVQAIRTGCVFPTEPSDPHSRRLSRKQIFQCLPQVRVFKAKAFIHKPLGNHALPLQQDVRQFPEG